MSYFRRGYSWEQIHYLPAPTGGWNPDSNPWTVPETQAEILDNFLIRPGKIVMRGAFKNWKDLSAFAPLGLAGVLPLSLTNDTLLVGRKNVSATAFIDPWFAPIVRPVAGSSIATPSLTLLTVPHTGAITTAAQASGAFIPGTRWINFNGGFYYISYGPEGGGVPVQDLSSSYFVQSTALGLSGTGIGTTAPHGPVDLKAFQSRIWLAGGIDTPGAGTKYEPTAIYFTNPISVGGGLVSADWKDPVTGLTNKIRLDGDVTDPCTALANGNNSLIVFRLNSIWRLRGSTTASYTVSPVTRETGCFDARSVVETDTGVYFLGTKGLMITDGVRVTNVSGPVTQTLQNAISLVYNSIKTGFGGYATCARVTDGQILVSVGAPSTTAGAPDGHIQPVWCGLFNPVTKTWVRITSQLFAADGVISVTGNNYPGWVVNTGAGALFALGDKFFTQLEGPAALTFSAPVNVAGNNTVTADDGGASGGTVPWALGGAYPTCVFPVVLGTTQSDALVASGFGFNVPASAVILGITAAAYRFSGGSAVTDHATWLRKAGVKVGTPKTTANVWPAQPAWINFGSTTDLWGTAWTPADVNNANFGFQMDATAGSFSGGTIQVAQMRVAVAYSIATATGSQSFVQTCTLYDVDASGNFQPIPAAWTTKVAPIVGASTNARKFGQAKRFFFDYLFQGDSLPSANGWTVEPFNSNLASLGSALTVPSRASSVYSGSVSGGLVLPSQQIQRANQDFANEIDDLVFRVTWADAQQSSAPSNALAELYGIGVEFQPTRDLK